MKRFQTLTRIGLGASAGVAATIAMQGIMMASKKLLPAAQPPIKKDPGEFMVEKVEKHLLEPFDVEVPAAAKKAAALSLALGYGLTAGALYAALRDGSEHNVLEGAGLGLAVWAIGYLGWLPAAGLMPPVTEQEFEQAVSPVVTHALFGVATTSVYHRLRRVV